MPLHTCVWSITARSKGTRVGSEKGSVLQSKTSITRQVVLEVLAQTSRGAVSRSTWLGLLASWLGTSAAYLWAINRQRGDVIVRHTSRARHALSPDYTPQPRRLEIDKWLQLAPGESAPWCDHHSDLCAIPCQCIAQDSHGLHVVAMGNDGPLTWFIGFVSHGQAEHDLSIAQRLVSLLPSMQTELLAYRQLRRDRLSTWIQDSGHANLNHPSSLTLVLRGRQLECLHAPDPVCQLLQEHDSIAALEDHYLVCRSPVHQARLIKTVQTLIAANRGTGRNNTALMHLSYGQRGSGLLLSIEAHIVQEATEKQRHMVLLSINIYAMRPQTPSADTLAACFGLTGMECTIAQMVLSGKSMADIGMHLSLPESSVRQHVQRTLKKAGYQHLTDMIQVLASMAPIPLPQVTVAIPVEAPAASLRQSSVRPVFARSTHQQSVV
jgi:DNA-binding NarL/FixJ family response regulator